MNRSRDTTRVLSLSVLFENRKQKLTLSVSHGKRLFRAFEFFSSAFNLFFMIEMFHFGNNRSGRFISAAENQVVMNDSGLNVQCVFFHDQVHVFREFFDCSYIFSVVLRF